MDISASAQIFL